MAIYIKNYDNKVVNIFKLIFRQVDICRVILSFPTIGDMKLYRRVSWIIAILDFPAKGGFMSV